MTEETKIESFEDYAMEQFSSLVKIAKMDLQWQRGIEEELRNARKRDTHLIVLLVLNAALALVAILR